MVGEYMIKYHTYLSVRCLVTTTDLNKVKNGSMQNDKDQNFKAPESIYASGNTKATYGNGKESGGSLKKKINKSYCFLFTSGDPGNG